MEFRNRISREEFSRIELDPKFRQSPLLPELFSHHLEYWEIVITETDFKTSINVFFKIPCKGLPVGYQLLIPRKLCDIFTLAEIIHNKGFKFEPSSVLKRKYAELSCLGEITHIQTQLRKLEGMVADYDQDLCKKFPLILVGYSQEGQFWLYEGNHRALSAFLSKMNDNNTPIVFDNCYCAISPYRHLPYFGEHLYGITKPTFSIKDEMKFWG